MAQEELLTSLATRLMAAQSFEDAAAASLQVMLACAEGALASEPRFARGKLSRGVVHVRPADSYRRLFCMEHPSGARANGTGYLTSANVWRWVAEHGCAVSIDVQLSTQLTDLEAKLAKCGDCCDRVAALETRVAGAEGKLLAHDKTFAGVDQRLAEQDQKIAGNAVKIAEQDQKIAALSGAIAMQDKKIATIDALDAEQEKKIAGAYVKVAEQDQKLVGLAERNAQQDTQLAEHTKQIADLAARAAKCQDCGDKLAVQQARIDDLVAQLGKHAGEGDRLAALQARIDDLSAKAAKCEDCDDKLAIQQARIDELSAKAAKCQDCEETIAGLKKVIDEQGKRIARLEGQKGPEIVQPPPVWPPPGAPAKLVVSYIHFIGAEKVSQGDEYIEIKNVGGTPQSIAGWRVRAGSAGQDFVFPAATMLEPGARLRVYTNHKEAGSFSPRAPSRSPSASSARTTARRAQYSDDG